MKKNKKFKLSKITISKLNYNQSSKVLGGATDSCDTECNDCETIDYCGISGDPRRCPTKKRTNQINCSGLC